MGKLGNIRCDKFIIRNSFQKVNKDEIAKKTEMKKISTITRDQKKGMKKDWDRTKKVRIFIFSLGNLCLGVMHDYGLFYNDHLLFLYT